MEIDSNVVSKNRIITISKHGKERIVERLMDDYCRLMVKDAWEQGEELNEKERQSVFTRGVYIDSKYWDSIYKKYMGHTYIYRNEGKKIIFVTVI